MERPYDPYGGEIAPMQPAPHGPVEDHSGGAVEQQNEMARRALEYKSRFETTPPSTGDVNRGSR
jgi:hypothetical protein